MRRVIALLALSVACTDRSPSPKTPEPAPAAAEQGSVLSIVGTNDLHGRLDALPIFAGYLKNLRTRRQTDGSLLLVDAGDMFQGTLESNLNEGAAVVEAYGALGYHAAAIGNHELDYGPVGAQTKGDPQGALKARVSEAKFAMLSANLITNGDWPGLRRSTLVELAGRRIGIIGALTEETPSIVMASYFAGLSLEPIVKSVEREAASLRAQGVDLVVLVAHAGGACKRFDDPRDLSSCDLNGEIFGVVRSLAPGSVDVVIAGHTHQGVAHVVGGTPVAEAYAHGRAFSRIDVRFDGGGPSFELHPPRDLCPENVDFSDCRPDSYEGAPVEIDPAIRALIAPAIERADEKRNEKIGVTLRSAVTESYGEPSALGNLFADLLREAVVGADVGIMNGGGLRAPLPAGELTYGALHEAIPFDNLLAIVRLTGAELSRVIAAHLASERHGILSISGLTARARCDGGELSVELTKDGRRVADDATLRVVISDYLATGGDNLLAPVKLDRGRIEILSELMRDAFVRRLAARGGAIDASTVEKRLIAAKRPVRCK